MKNFFPFFLCVTLNIVTFAQSDTWSVKFSNAIISRYQPTINAMTNKGWEYSNGSILHGMEKVYLNTHDADYLNYIKAYVDSYVDASGNVTGLGMTVDKIQPGVLCLFLYEQTGQTKYKTAATQIKNYVNNFYKTPDGGIWHKSEQNVTSYKYYNVMMVDGMYMLHPFLTKYASMFNEPALFDAATFQLLFLASKVMPQPMTLPKHAWEYYDYKAWSDPSTHMSTDVWSRGTGWYMMALADVLEYLPTSHANYGAILELFQRMSSGVAANQHPTTGLWYQVVDKRTETGNWTESSGSGMFVYALKKGVEKGWLNAATYNPVINLGWQGLQTQIAILGDSGPQIKQFCVATGVVDNTAAYYALGKTDCPTAYPWSGTQHPHGYCGILMAASVMEFNTINVPATGVAVSPASLTLSVGNTQQLTATVAPSNATNKSVTWSSSNTSVATVSSTGLVTAVVPGNAVITTTTQDGNFTSSSSVTVNAVIPCTTIQYQAESGTFTSGTTIDTNWAGYTGTGFINTPNATGSYLQITVTALIAGTHDFTIRFANGTTTDRTASVAMNGSTVLPSLSMAATGSWSTWSTSAFSVPLVAGTNTIRFTALTTGGLANIDRIDMCQKYMPVTGVTVTPASATLAPGGTQQLTVNVEPTDAINKVVSWSSSNTSVATVSSTGLVTAVAAGNAAITATTQDGSFTATCQITVSAVSVTGITVSPSSATLEIGETTTLIAAVFPVNATNKVVSWSSSNTSVATVSSTGLVTAVAAGNAAITATTQDGSFTATCQITVSAVSVTGITVSPSSATLEIGETTTLIAAVLPANATNKVVSWSSSNTSVATVSSAGLVTAVASGNAVIIVTTQDGNFTSSSSVTVNAVIPCTTIQYQAESGTFTSGTTIDTNWAGYTGTGFINTPNATGSYLQITVTALIAGTHDFTIRFANGTTTDRTASVAMNGSTVLPSLSMAATGSWSTWSTSAFSVPLVAGTNTIRFTALTTGGLANIDRIDMCQKYIPVTGVTVSPASATLAPGGTQQLTATVEPANASYPSVTWSSGNTLVATVNSSGHVTAVSSGTTVITATTTNGLAAASQVIVSSIPVTGVSVNPSSANVKAGEIVTLTATVQPSDASNKNVTWHSSNPAVASVSNSGVVTAISEGLTNITVTSVDGNFTAVCPVTVYVIHVTGITVNPAVATIMIGSTTMLTAAITPSDANNQNYSWSSSNSSIATVSSSGVVTGISEGTAVITVTSADGGFTAPCNITVIPIAVTGVGITPSTVTTRIGANTTLMATVAPSNATNKTVSWSSSDTGVATVSSAGVVTGVAAGTAVITVTTEDGGYTANSIITVSGTCNATGYITFEKWLNIYGITVASLTGNAKYPNNPSSSTTLTSFEIPTNSANYYGSRISGYICPPATGNYTFWIAADDAAQLWLSTNNLEANKVLIAYTDKYTSSRQWNKYSTQKSAVIYLVQGNTYYIEALHKEGTVNDNMAVGWLKPGQTGTSPSQVIPGSVLSPRTPLKIATIESRSALIPVLDVYPNPARNEILFNLPENLLGEKVVVSIMSMNGQVILNKELTFSGPEQTDIRSCVPGLYILRVQNKDFSINKSFVVYR